MPEVLAAQREYKKADQDALAMRARARARLGLAVKRERDRGASQPEIAKELGVVVEQVRRYEAAYKEWAERHPGESLD